MKPPYSGKDVSNKMKRSAWCDYGVTTPTPAMKLTQTKNQRKPEKLKLQAFSETHTNNFFCWQHKGLPAMLPASKLIVQG